MSTSLRFCGFAAGAWVISLALNGCGGGGGSAGTSAIPSDFPSGASAVASGNAFPIDAALAAFFQASRQFTLTGGYPGQSRTLTYTITPRGSTTPWNTGVPAQQTDVVAHFADSNVSTDQETESLYFQTSPFQIVLVNTVDSANVTTQFTPLPATATVGQSGTYEQVTDYTDMSESSILATETLTWRLYPDTASTAWWCLIDHAVGQEGGDVMECYRLDASGNVLGFKVATSDSSGTQIFQ